MMPNKTIARILSELGDDTVLDRLTGAISPSELNSLLLELFRGKTDQLSYGDLLKSYARNRFVQPAELSPIALKQLELAVLQIAEGASFRAVQLSPVAPLGSCSVVATADQNKILSAVRGTEVVADATNALALHICHLIKSGKLGGDGEMIRFGTTHRHVRAQSFNKPGLFSHFHLFCMVSSGKDKGSYEFEKQALAEHLCVYRTIFQSLLNHSIQVRVTRRMGYTDNEGLLQRVMDYVYERLPDVHPFEVPYTGDNAYYQGLQFTLIVPMNGQDIVIGDGGYVDWPQKLLNNKKQRMMISAIGLDRLLPFLD